MPLYPHDEGRVQSKTTEPADAMGIIAKYPSLQMQPSTRTMSISREPHSDLGDLILSANEQIAVKDARRRTRVYRDNPLSRLLPVLATVAALAAGGWMLLSLWHHLAPHSEEKVLRDLDKIIEQARRSVDTARETSGQMPLQIPNASLAGLVSYEYGEDSYSLQVTSGKVQISIDADGRKTVNSGG